MKTLINEKRPPGRPKKDAVEYHRPGVRLDQTDRALLEKLVRAYGSEAQAIRVAIRELVRAMGQ